MAEALAWMTESERAEFLRGLGATEREQASRPVRHMPLPVPRRETGIVSAVERV
ncbi:hypothetical protein ACIBCM_23910 [Streptomyces sp. NPDC051018]|uniref:hypothetical protein n=1 Tax=Streptomyces sp. NPDC051018 TaxID=3365639 RepID=UPI0037A4BEA1